MLHPFWVFEPSCYVCLELFQLALSSPGLFKHGVMVRSTVSTLGAGIDGQLCPLSHLALRAHEWKFWRESPQTIWGKDVTRWVKALGAQGWCRHHRQGQPVLYWPSEVDGRLQD